MNRSLRPIGVIAALSMCFWLALGAGLAFADDSEDDEDFARTGVYFGLNGVGGLGVDRRFDPTELSGGGGLNARFGSRESERLSWELEFEWLMFPDPEINNLTFGINGKFYFAEQRWQPYVVLGAGSKTVLRSGPAPNNTDWGFRMGGGLDYYLTRHWALNTECVYVVGVGGELRLEYGSFSLGAIYRF